MGDLAYLFHIRPWEIDLLEVDDFLHLVAQCERTRQEQQKA